jgi:hypothetical protein
LHHGGREWWCWMELIEVEGARGERDGNYDSQDGWTSIGRESRASSFRDHVVVFWCRYEFQHDLVESQDPIIASTFNNATCLSFLDGSLMSRASHV